MNVYFETFGCRLNRAEALEEEARYLASGFTRVGRASEADIAVVRGCSVTARAQRDCEKRIDQLRRHHPHLHVIVAGCLATRKSDFHAPAALASSDALPMSTARAYLKVQDGCAGACTFCIVPSFRGPSVSVPFADVVAKARRFLEAGYRELVLTGCNLALYLSDGKRLADLVLELASLADAFGGRVRVGSVEPGPAAEALVGAMSVTANVCRFLHVPVQSASDRILKSMARPYRRADVEALVTQAVKALSGLGLGCDLMSGFPGETESDHVATLALLETHAFSNVHVFPFSERPGTPAAHFAGVVPPEVRSARAHAIAEKGQAARLRFALRQIGRTVGVVVEDDGHPAGWTGEYLWCRVRGGAHGVARRRALVRVLVTGADGDRLVGREIG